MSQTSVDKVANHIAESAHQAHCATEAIADVITDGVEFVKRTAKHGTEVAEDFLNDTTHRLKRNPGLTVAATFVVGLTAGAFLGWMMKRS